MNKKGFTLIELLAVIVILAIIALIATPIVLNIINESKESAQLRSAEMYLKGVETSVSTATINKSKVKNGTYQITKEGNICLVDLVDNECSEEKTLKVEINGETPVSGTITIKNSQIKDIKLIYSNNKTIVKNSEGCLIYSELESDSNEKTIEVGKLNSVCEPSKEQLYATDPLEVGYKYDCYVDPSKEEPYSFFVLTQPVDGTINLIMDRNICEDGTLTDANKEQKCLVVYTSSGNPANRGPDTAMTYLNNATSTWENIDNLNMTYDDEGKQFEDFVLNGKARLPYYSEVSAYDSENKTNAYLYDYLKLSGTKQTNPISGIEGYWTLSSQQDTLLDAWYVCFDGRVTFYGYVGKTTIGVRPVITLKI